MESFMDKNDINVSVIIPIFNSEKTIFNVLIALENQSAAKYIKEIIVVNDGSNDKSLQLVETFSENSKIIVNIISQVNQGVSSARNAGMQIATGSWIAFNDSDDYWYPDKLERQLDVLMNNADIDFLGCNHSESELKILTKKIDVLYKAKLKDICFKMFPQPSTVIFKKQIFDEIGGFDINQRYAEDGNYFLKICLKYNYYYLPEKLINYGSGKKEFGDSGLSANLIEMYRGNLKNIIELKNKKIISSFFYAFLRIYYWCKYIRRIILTIGYR